MFYGKYHTKKSPASNSNFYWILEFVRTLTCVAMVTTIDSEVTLAGNVFCNN